MAKRLRVGKFVGDTIRITPSITWVKWTDGTISQIPIVGNLTSSKFLVDGHTKGNVMGVYIGNSVTSIEYGAFSNCSHLTSVTIPDSVTRIGQFAFENCTGLTNVTIPDSVTIISQLAFQNCTNLTSVTIPDSVISIGTGDFPSFKSCSGLRDVTIPQYVCERSLSSIFPAAYYKIINVVISEGATSIGSQAFTGCSRLAVFDFHNHQSVPQLGSTDAFYNTPSTKKIVVPDDLYNDWKTATNWSSTTNNIVGSIIRYSDYINT